MTSLELGSNEISDASPLATLISLTSLELGSNEISDLSPLAALTSLTSLELGGSQISDASPLAALTSLTSLELDSNEINDLSPLTALTSLTSLNLSRNEINDLSPLTMLTSLTSLELDGNQISDLTPLAALTALTSLYLNGNQISDLTPLAALTALTSLSLRDNQIRTFPDFVLQAPALNYLVLHRNSIQNVPTEVLGSFYEENCLPAVRAHMADKAYGVALDQELKLILLGNARTGKTSLVKRLVEEPFDPDEPSTHAIQLRRWSLPASDPPLQVNIWDFGGQDIYLGTHALFLRSHALFLLVWDRLTEGEPGYTEGPLFFEHFPLQYWRDYIRETSPDSPEIVVENKCDDGRSSPAPHGMTGSHLAVSASTGHGCSALVGLIRDTAARELDRLGPREIGIGRWAVKKQLLAYWAEDEARAPDARRYRTLRYEAFAQLCAEQEGQVSSAEELLRYLHNTGVVYYQTDLFHNQIILDQRWAIEAIYSIFHRESAYRQLTSKHGRFRRIDLQDLVWQDRPEAEQRLFLSFMESCALCFQIQKETKDHDAEYVAPDLLPEKDTVAVELGYRLEARGPDAVYYRYTHAFLHQATMRRFMVQMGRQYQDRALYWKDGLCIEPPQLHTLALVECERAVDGNPAVGRITLEVRGPQRERVLNGLRAVFEYLEPRHPDITQAVSLDGMHWVDMAKLEDARLLGQVVSDPPQVLDFQPFRFLLAKDAADDLFDYYLTDGPDMLPPSDPARSMPTIYLSYAWGDARETGPSREAIVDQLYASLITDGYHVKRDKMDLGYKGLISAFMQEIGRGDLIVVVISDKYLKSPYCMYELLEISQHQNIHERIFPIVLEDAKIREPEDCADYVIFWRDKENGLRQAVEKVGLETLSPEGGLFQRYKRYQAIMQNADHLIDYLADMNTLTSQLLAANDFATIKRAIDDRLAELSRQN